ncbi:MAG: hypothetical protein MUF38_06450 [Anaerolineae bacterium]|nr:hypothetical protein [Anaerolineae bacterium]
MLPLLVLAVMVLVMALGVATAPTSANLPVYLCLSEDLGGRALYENRTNPKGQQLCIYGVPHNVNRPCPPETYDRRRLLGTAFLADGQVRCRYDAPTLTPTPEFTATPTGG